MLNTNKMLNLTMDKVLKLGSGQKTSKHSLVDQKIIRISRDRK